MKRIEIKTGLNPENERFLYRLLNRISLTAIFMVFSITSFAQKDCKTLSGKFQKNQITGLNNKTVDHKKNYLIHIDNLNTARYKVSFKFNDFDWETEPPATLGQLLPGIKNYTAGFSDTNKNHQESLNENLVNLVAKLNGIIIHINNHSDSVQKKDIKNIQKISNDVLKSMGTDTTNYKEFLAKFQNNINYIKGFYSALKEFNAESPKGSFEYVQLLAKMEGLVNQLNAKNYPKLFMQIVTWAKKAPDNFIYSDTHFPEKEVTTLQIIVTDRFSGDTVCNYSTDIYRTGVFKIDFSTGIGVNSLVKPTYSMANNGSPYIHKENGRDLDLSVMALLHANWRLKRNFTFGPTAGVSVSTFDANTGFVLGVSGSFGTRNTISVSTGGIMGKSYKLSSRVSSDGNKADIPLEAGMTEIPKVDAVNYGWFVSVTYNLTRTKKP